MRHARIAFLCGTTSLGAVYVSCGPLPCDRTHSSRCGLLAYDYPGNVGLLPPQLLVTMAIVAFVVTVLVWFSVAKGHPPVPVRFLAGLVLAATTLLAMAGLGGMVGMGVPFVLPFLWLAACDSTGYSRTLWIVLAGCSGAVASWTVAALLGTEWNGYIMFGVGAGVAILFALTTDTRNDPLAEGGANDLG